MNRSANATTNWKSEIASIGIANEHLIFALCGEVLLFIVSNKLQHIRITNVRVCVLHRTLQCEYIEARAIHL